MSPGPAGSLQLDLFAPAASAGVMEFAAGAAILTSPAKPARVPERPGPRRPQDQALLVRLLTRDGGASIAAAGAAAALLDRFGDIRTTVTADAQDLAGVVGPAAAAELRLSYELALAVFEQPLRERDLISSCDALKRYLVAALSGRTREAFHVLFLDSANRLIADERLGEGTVNGAPVYPREVVRKALQYGATNLIIVHNHPGGSDAPSKDDQTITKLIVAAAKTMGIAVLDHVIVAGDTLVSFRALNLL